MDEVVRVGSSLLAKRGERRETNTNFFIEY